MTPPAMPPPVRPMRSRTERSPAPATAAAAVAVSDVTATAPGSAAPQCRARRQSKQQRASGVGGAQIAGSLVQLESRSRREHPPPPPHRSVHCRRCHSRSHLHHRRCRTGAVPPHSVPPAHPPPARAPPPPPAPRVHGERGAVSVTTVWVRTKASPCTRSRLGWNTSSARSTVRRR